MSDVIFHVIILLLLLLLVVFWPFFIDGDQYHVTLKFLRGSDTGLPPKTLQFYILILQCRPTTTMCPKQKRNGSHSYVTQ